MPTFFYEDQHDGLVVGLDEAGCGPWAGPVVAGAAVIDRLSFPNDLLTTMTDSKKMSASQREKVIQAIAVYEGHLCFTAVGMASVEEIDRLNIRAAGILAMERAFKALALPSQPSFALVDGTVKPQLSCPSLSLKKGDSLSYSVALASIVAKVTRDHLMKELAAVYPAYGWEKNAGYGTAGHRQALADYGVTPHHRRSFAPIAALINEAA